MEHFYADLYGWFDYQDFYAAQVESAVNNDKFVEVGTWCGKSAAFMGVEIVNSGKNIFFDVVDTWEGSQNYQEQVDYVAAHGGSVLSIFQSNMTNGGLTLGNVAQQINVVTSDGAAAAAGYDNVSLKFVFIDADHSLEVVAAQIAAWWPKVKSGGILAGHDYNESNFPDVKTAVDDFGTCESIGTVWYFVKP